MNRHKETLYINTWSSECGNCGKGANPMEKTHKTVLGYAKDQPSGCGIKWKYVSTHYVDLQVGDMRPDLICY